MLLPPSSFLRGFLQSHCRWRAFLPTLLQATLARAAGLGFKVRRFKRRTAALARRPPPPLTHPPTHLPTHPLARHSPASQTFPTPLRKG